MQQPHPLGIIRIREGFPAVALAACHRHLTAVSRGDFVPISMQVSFSRHFVARTTGILDLYTRGLCGDGTNAIRYSTLKIGRP